MTELQKDLLLKEFHLQSGKALHHGLCVGADEQAHWTGRSLGLWIVGHPPTAQGLRAHLECDELRPEQPFHVRNRAICRKSELLIATPDGPERLRSGTWTTVRFARKLDMPIVILMPDGTRKLDGLWARTPPDSAQEKLF